ncbi:MAG: putative lipid II flippase FtsW [Mariprofundaceae bacterium]|nr:putative lipid II flippase FtsW [Mariprofundaceae bacterium]
MATVVRHKQLQSFDSWLLVSVLLLSALSMVMISSASMTMAEHWKQDAFYFVKNWLIYMPAGLLLMYVISRIEVSWWQAATMPLLLCVFTLMVSVLVFGTKINHAQRWLSFFSLSFQPVEILKPIIILYTAHYISSFPERLQNFSHGLAPMLVVTLSSLFLLLLQPDFGNAALIISVCLAMWFVGGIPLRHLLMFLATIIPIGLVILVSESYRVKRLMSFLDPWADAQNSGYQLVQSLLAYGSGGVYGKGLGQGIQKLFYLPEPYTDFIAAVLAEELGLIGSLSLVALFMIIFWRSMVIVYQTPDVFSRLLVLGSCLLLVASFMINLGTTMGLLPTKGMPLPIISYGGSALLGSYILLGFIFSVQRHQS